MLNRITLIGRLTRDPLFTTTSTGKEVVQLSIAVNRRGSDGIADFFNVKAWGQTAKYVNEYIGKGRLVSIDGRLETNNYEKDGKQLTSYHITAENINALDRPKDGISKPSKESKPKSSDDDEYDPFADE